MPIACHFNVTMTKLQSFRDALQTASSSPESHWSSWQTCWETVCDSLDQAECRAHAAGDLEAAKQVLRLNKLIQWCLKPDWDQIGQVDGVAQQSIRCGLLDCTDQWDRFKFKLNRYHIEIFEQSIADLVSLQQSTQMLPECTWAHTAEVQVGNLIADVAEVLERNRIVESQ